MLAKELLRIHNLEKTFVSRTRFGDLLNTKRVGFVRKEHIYALNGVNLVVNKGECLCVVGETGCGKTTLARVLMGLESLSSGEILYQGERIDVLSDRQRMKYRKKMQMVFQSPHASLNPKMTVYQMLYEAVSLHHPYLNKQETENFISGLLDSVGLSSDAQDKYPHQFSGGQRQRISLARALSVEPEFIVADEPLAALDVSVQAQVLNLMSDMKDRLGLTYLFITHDLAVVEHFATRVAVMYLGTICEIASREILFQTPKHPYTRALLSAIPRLDNLELKSVELKGDVPTPTVKPTGCPFASRCLFANQRCYEQFPESLTYSDGSSVACHAIEEGRIAWK